MFGLGIDIGYSSVKTVLTDENLKIVKTKYDMHHGKAFEILKNHIEEILNEYDISLVKFAAITGNGGKYIGSKYDIEFVNEVTALVEGSCAVGGEIKSIVEIGGESAKYITNFSADDKTKIEISMNSNCSSGTGSFLEEQANRLKITLDNYSLYADAAKSIPRIAGRCSVFAKTDIIHHQQEGVSVEDILLGLSYSLIRNYNSSVIKRLPVNKPVFFAGGVSKNTSIIRAMKDVLKLGDEDLIVNDKSSCATAYGCAALSVKNGLEVNIGNFIETLEKMKEGEQEENSDNGYQNLSMFGNYDYVGKHSCNTEKIEKHSDINCYLGVDIGSTSTNVVLMDEDKNIIDFKYLRTSGKPREVLLEAMKEFGNKYDKRVTIMGVGITGSGRYMLGRLIGADLIVDEITAQARAAIELNPDVDTVFEIGGQDSKYIKIDRGVVTDFKMNKICAAGTGSFIEEQSVKFDIPIEEFGDMALNSDNPLSLGERCTVFIESSIAANLSRGAKINDIASGLCYSIVRNYLDRVVGNGKIGDNIFLQGGIAYNQGVLNAFRALTGKKISIPDYFSITGAYGAAILSVEKMLQKDDTDFRGFYLEKDKAGIQNAENIKDEKLNKFSKDAEKILFKNYDGSIDPNKKTVGIPRSLFTYGMFSMFYRFFKELGFNVILSNSTDEKTISMAQQYSLDETCYPVKLINGHMADLVNKKVDYIFFPDLFTVDHPGSESRQNYGCAYMQLAFKMVNKSMNLEEKGIELLSPTIAFSFGKEFMGESFMKLGKKLGRNDEEIKKALQMGMKELMEFEDRLETEAERVMKDIDKEEKVFVVISKIYGAVDPVLNMGIPDKLESMGYKVLPFYNMPETEINDEYPNLFWPFGQHIVEPAKLIKENPNMYAILLTHHGCGPDSIVSHYFKREMGDKPFLHIEVDEHSSKVGVITRLEAFVNSINSVQATQRETVEMNLSKFGLSASAVKTEEANYDNLKAVKEKVFLTNLHPYSDIFAKILRNKGINCEVLDEIDEKSLQLGKKYMIAEEYFSTTAILGNVMKNADKLKDEAENFVYLIPKNEGAEVDGQYAKFISTKLETEEIENAKILSPFIEDIIYSRDTEFVDDFMNTLIAGDILRLAPERYRNVLIEEIMMMIDCNNFNSNILESLAEKVYEYVNNEDFRKTVMVIGDPFLLFNDFMNNRMISELEDKGNRVLYTPMSEYMWMMWKDHANFNRKEGDKNYLRNISELENKMSMLSYAMKDKTNFEMDFFRLLRDSTRLIGYYSGMNGRYRYAKAYSDSINVDGMITVSSMYENTGIMLNILKNDNARKTPVLNLTFDGNKNDNDRIKIDSFMYYI